MNFKLSPPQSVSLIALIFLLSSPHLSGQMYPPPSGIYCSCPPTTSSGSSSITAATASKPFLSGSLVRISWADLEPIDNVYDWGLIDNQIDSAKVYGIKITLAVLAGQRSPAWLVSQGSQLVTFTNQQSQLDTVPLPWDNLYLAKWTEFIQALGDRYDGNSAVYDSDTSITLIHMSHGTVNGLEMLLPSAINWLSLGYTDQLYIDSWKQVIHAYNLAFPNRYLDNDFHELFGNDLPADSIYAFASTTLGNRYGAFAAWWTDLAIPNQPNMMEIMVQSAQLSFSTTQFARSFTLSPSQFGPGGLQSAFDSAMVNNICYWEIWNQDLENPSLNALFTSIDNNYSCFYPPFVNLEKPRPSYQVYPNPSNGKFWIETKQPIDFVEVLSMNGQVILRKNSIVGNQVSIDFSAQPKGIFLLKVHFISGQVSFKKLMQEK